ncbi:protein phosphatase 1H isoform X1 [Anabrus simplex]|uniref:protein phosphatase 1H isoform X1 n=1 Tax=Anabrus simplex TaxID=316456 RepID=UPI0034DD3473
MFTRVRNVLYNVVGGLDTLPVLRDSEGAAEDAALVSKFPYTRPHFLLFHSDEEIQWSADHQVRPIIVPRDFSKLPWNTGYAEAVNAGKSRWNEDQACLRRSYLQRPESKTTVPQSTVDDLESSCPYPEHLNAACCLPYVYFAMFDGHAGVGAAVAAANQLHHILHEKLVDVVDHLLPPLEGVPAHNIAGTSRHGAALWYPEKEVSKDSLIIGALESSFWDMDELIEGDRRKYQMKGGCTALVALFILGKVYIANAGDSRAVLCRNRIAIPLSHDFTPETERHRIRRLAALQPQLLGGEFTHLDYSRRLTAKDLGKRVLYRDAYMTGWAYKTVTPSDLKFPVVFGEGKRSRVLATIGVTRGFGDHDLKALYSNVPIKPFLLSQPEVQVFDIQNEEITDNDVLIMGTDGLWDVTANEKAVEIVCRNMDHFPAGGSKLKYRYISAAQDLVMHSRGKLVDESWRSEGRAATIDDISVFVIPLNPYKEEFLLWKQQYDAIRGIYDSGSDTADPYGKLLLKPSPSTRGRSRRSSKSYTTCGLPAVQKRDSTPTSGLSDTTLKFPERKSESECVEDSAVGDFSGAWQIIGETITSDIETLNISDSSSSVAGYEQTVKSDSGFVCTKSKESVCDEH